MRLVDSDDRDEFEGVDGPTALMDHLNRITEEQATLGYAWEASTIGEGSWEPYEVQESLILTIVAICHACIEETIGRQCLELGAGRLLWEIYVCAPIAIASELYMLILSAYRNLAFAPALPGALPEEMIHESWRLVAESAEIEQRVLGAEILTNLSVQDPSRVHPTQEHIATLLQLFFTNDDETALRIALVDLLSNLACDPGLCLLIIYELDERKPRRYRRHSGAVYFLDLTEVTPDPALQQSMEALAHNLSWSDPAGKRKIQKLGLSSFMTRFALEPAINN
ncbi:hypothetical protein Poli38472_000831 [Pythium oligandrum]|uniref:Uncharacterized protein n=1 Tax=Pythium oligandrum TaxID=41045 RepID=A0A8K1CCD0_PYTOL|nr:hypothetical protein Poli38472_000831 [Pythium oligandrum]|eukprot:TMW60789.1 hypothetical protein Poli38472_000831 [Pythium oligandrum]